MTFKKLRRDLSYKPPYRNKAGSIWIEVYRILMAFFWITFARHSLLDLAIKRLHLTERLLRGMKSTNLYPFHQHCSRSHLGFEGHCSCSCLVHCLYSHLESDRCHYKEWELKTNKKMKKKKFKVKINTCWVLTWFSKRISENPCPVTSETSTLFQGPYTALRLWSERDKVILIEDGNSKGPRSLLCFWAWLL